MDKISNICYRCESLGVTETRIHSSHMVTCICCGATTGIKSTREDAMKSWIGMSNVKQEIVSIKPLENQALHANKLKYNLTWSDTQNPTSDNRYTHIEALTPFGRILIVWEGWMGEGYPHVKEHPVSLAVFDTGTLEQVKQQAEYIYVQALKMAYSQVVNK